MMRTELLRKTSLSVAALAIGSFATSSAEGYCRATTESPITYDPISSGACYAGGAPLFLRSQCLPYRLLAKESSIISNAVLSDRLAKAFAVWGAPNPNCTPGVPQGIELAPTNATTIASYVPSGANENVIGVPETWTHAADLLVVPIISFDRSTGEILDVDMEINPNIPWTLADPIPAEGYDLEAALTHAVGHVLGLAESSVVGSAMYPRYDRGDTSQRALDTDDQQAICSIYPNRTQRNVLNGSVAATACNLSPAAGGTCGDPEITHGCSTSPAGGSSSAGSLVLGLVAIAGFARVRRRQPGM